MQTTVPLFTILCTGDHVSAELMCTRLKPFLCYCDFKQDMFFLVKNLSHSTVDLMTTFSSEWTSPLLLFHTDACVVPFSSHWQQSVSYKCPQHFHSTERSWCREVLRAHFLNRDCMKSTNCLVTLLSTSLLGGFSSYCHHSLQKLHGYWGLSICSHTCNGCDLKIWCFQTRERKPLNHI